MGGHRHLTMNNLRRVVIGVAIVIVAAGIAWLIAERVDRGRHPAAPPTIVQSPTPPAAVPKEEVAIQRPEFKHTEEGRLAWQVRLNEMKLSAGGGAVAAAGMREALIYDKNGAPVLRLSARTARGNAADRDLEVSGNVRAVSQEGAIITTEQVQWLEKERRLHCPGKVTMRSRDAALTTNGLNFFVDQDLVKCPNTVRMYSGDNKLSGCELVYNIKTQSYELHKVQAIFRTQQLGAAAPAAKPTTAPIRRR